MRSALLAVTCVSLAACAPPFGVRHATPEQVHRELTRSVLSTGELSNPTEILLRRENLIEAFHDDPDGALRVLRDRMQAGVLLADNFFELAELSFQHADRGGGKPHFLAAAVYAYAFAFPDDPRLAPSPFDPRLRVAMDLYNRALTEAFESADGLHVDVAGGTRQLPFGEMEVSFDDTQLAWGKRRLADFSPAAEVEVIGFRNRYRQPGIGAPLAAATPPTNPNEPLHDFVGPNVRVPVTAFLRLPRPRAQALGERLTGILELHLSTDAPTTAIDGRAVPLEEEPTASLAIALNVAQPWETELGIFLGHMLQVDLGTTFGGPQPHRRGHIPVVFVHGTASNFSVWANMVNDLSSDPVIRDHFDFWFFRYDSGQPILYSGMLLRRALTNAAKEFQSAGPDPCVDEMVVIGHSQGGLLVKLTAIDSGDRFWRNLSDGPVEQSGLSPENQALAREVFFVEPLPFVDRVVFIATPQRGSYLAGPAFVRALAQRLISLPATVAQASAALLSSSDIARRAGLQRIPTSIDNMSPGHPFIKTIAGIPVAPGIAVNSIIGVVDGEPLATGGDGVVKYQSAHIDGVESELVVPYEHSMQAQPEVVAEVQRILHRQLKEHPCSTDTATPAPNRPGH